MCADWPRVKISDVCELIVDCVNKTAPHVEHQTPYKMVRTPNIKNGNVDLSVCRFVEEETYIKWTRRAKVLRGDVLLTREAPMGQVGYVDFDQKVFLGQRIMQYRAKPEVLDSKFLLYSFLSPDLQHQFFMHEGSGSVVSHIRVPDCSNFEINIPPIEIQKKIAKILWDIDKKIKINTQTNQTLETIAQTLFKSWFVDFDPVKAKLSVLAAGGSAEEAERAAMCAISARDEASLNTLQTEQPEAYAELARTAALFPSAMQDSELGEIPVGWNFCKILDLSLKISKGTTPRKVDIKSALDKELVPFLKVKDITFNGEILADKLEKIPDSVHQGALKRSILKTNDILFTIAGTIGRVAIIEDYLSNTNCNQAVAFIRLREPNKFLELCRLHLIEDRIQNEVVSKVVQGVQANLSLSNLGRINILVPSDELLDRFNENICRIGKEVRLRLAENRNLSELRDTLLPKLLSGELTLPDTTPPKANPPESDTLEGQQPQQPLMEAAG